MLGDSVMRTHRLETRELAYFVAVAEELHFGRAAERLGIAQPPLSRAIRQLERRVGVALLERGARGVTLTPAGEVLLHEGRRALDAVAAAGRRAHRAGQPDPRLVLAMKPGGDGGLLPDILAAYESEPDATAAVDVLVCGIGEQEALLRDGRADAGLLHLPHDDPSGFDTEELLVEGQVVVLPRGHRLSGRASVRLADLAGETMPRWPGSPDDGDGRPLVRDAGQLMQLIALGRTVAVLPRSAAGHLREDLVCVPVADAAPTTVVLAWPEQSRSRALAALVRAATAVAARRSAAPDRHGDPQGEAAAAAVHASLP
jgi:DNA-binding transcriptional LysR family regulator